MARRSHVLRDFNSGSLRPGALCGSSSSASSSTRQQPVGAAKDEGQQHELTAVRVARSSGGAARAHNMSVWVCVKRWVWWLKIGKQGRTLVRLATQTDENRNPFGFGSQRWDALTVEEFGSETRWCVVRLASNRIGERPRHGLETVASVSAATWRRAFQRGGERGGDYRLEKRPGGGRRRGVVLPPTRKGSHDGRGGEEIVMRERRAGRNRSLEVADDGGAT